MMKTLIDQEPQYCGLSRPDGVLKRSYRACAESFDGSPQWYYFAVPFFGPTDLDCATHIKCVSQDVDPDTVTWQPMQRELEC